MGKAIGEILPYALGAAISVVPIIAIILMFVTPKAQTNGTSFAAGFVVGLAVICVVAVALAGRSNFSSGSGPTKTVSIIKLLLGLLLVAAVRQWRARPKPGETPKMPKWLESIDQFTPPRSFGIGLALSAINPKNSPCRWPPGSRSRKPGCRRARRRAIRLARGTHVRPRRPIASGPS
jgi:Sap, sulfolipid-1-addressing protein